MRDEQVFTVRGDAELVARAGHLFTAVRTEFVCAALDLATWAQPEARAAVRRGTEHGDLTVRKLLTPRALADEAGRAHLEAVQAHGARVRISAAALTHETIVLDRRVMIMADRERPGTPRSYTITSSPTLVEGALSLFEAIWSTAEPPAAYLTTESPRLSPDDRPLLDALASGLTDESAARRLGLSLRTYRRRVATLMTTLSATSRFQAGYNAATRDRANSLSPDIHPHPRPSLAPALALAAWR
ncbi:DNA-binding response regulator [Actinocorallia sp. A-T 12471]|uniref:DNA-binding response regulator n=1 Tax=Actinocorallia sp. A-T 12471 TaxID=3089813 RepID=UPI0029CBBCC7|nr:DNA-binding response regulator [Actinocorallia sp. A-T 12471]MDX6741843.1 DNA-binding response regulator [Actinocorallia sp. A-T 12471]